MARGSGGVGGAIARNIGVKLLIEGGDEFMKVLGEANESVKAFSEVLGNGGNESFGSLFGKATTGASAFSTALGYGLYNVISNVTSGMWDAGKSAFNLTAEFEKNQQSITAMTAIELMQGKTQKEMHEGFMTMSVKQQEELQQKSWDYDQLSATLENARIKLEKLGDEGKTQTAQYLGQQATVEELANKYQKLGEQIDALAGIEGTPYTYTTEKQVSTVRNMDEALVEARKPASEMIDRMTRLALISPFNRKGIMTAVEQGKAFGMTLVETEGLVTGLTKFATVSGRTESHINRITYAIGQTKSMGKVMMRQVRQMNQAGLSVQDMAASMGMGVEQFGDEVGKGNIHFTEFTANLSKFLETTYDTAFNNINDSFRGLKNALGDIKEMATVNLFTGILEAFKPIMASIVHPFTKGGMLQTIKVFGDEFGLLFKDMFATVAGYIDSFMLFFTDFVGRISNPIKIKINLATEKQAGLEKQQTKYDTQMSGAMEGGTQYSQEYMNNLTYLGQINAKLTDDTKKQTALQALYNTGLSETASQLSYLNGIEKKLGENIWLNGEKGKRNMEGEAGMYWEQKDAIGALNAQNIEYRNTLNDLGVAIKNGTAASQDRSAWQTKTAASGAALSERYRDLTKSQKDLEAAGKTATPMYREQAAEMLVLEANAKLYIESHAEFMKTQDANLLALQAIADLNKEAGASVPWLKAFRDTLRDTREEGDPLIVIFDQLIVIFDKIRTAWEGATNPTGKSLFTQLKEFFSEKILTALASIVTFIANNIDFIIIFVSNVARLFAIVAGYGAIASVIGRVLLALGFLATPFGILLTIVGGLSKAYETNFGGFKTWIDDMKPILNTWVATVKTKFKNLFTFGPEYSKSFSGLKTTLGTIVTAISDKIKAIVPTPAEMQTRLTNLGTWIDYYFATWKAKVMSWLPSTESIDKWVTTVQDIFKKLTTPASTNKEGKMSGGIYDWKDALLDVQLAYGVTETKAKEVVKSLADNLAWFQTKWGEFTKWLPEQWDIIKGKLSTKSEEISNTILGYFTLLKTKIVDFFAQDIFNAIKTVWNYKSEGKSGIEQEYEDAMKRLETYFGTKKFETVIQFGTNIESVIETTLSRIKTFFAKEVPKAMADAFKIGFGQGEEPRPDMDAQVKAVGEGLQVTPEVAKAIVGFIELVGEKFQSWAKFADEAYTNTKKAVEYLYVHRDAWFPTALNLTAALSIFTIGSYLWVSIGKFWTASGLAASTKWVGGLLGGLGGWAKTAMTWLPTLFMNPAKAMGVFWAGLGKTGAVKFLSSMLGGLKNFVGPVFAWIAKFGSVMWTGMTELWASVTMIYNGTVTLATGISDMGATAAFFGKAFAAIGAVTAFWILVIIAAVSALVWGFYTNFQGMTDNFWVFADTLGAVWTDVLWPFFKQFWEALKMLGGFMYLTLVWFWEHILKGIFEDFAAAFNNLILVLTWLLNMFIDFWNFISPVLIPVLLVLAVIVGGVLWVVFMAILALIAALIRIVSLIVRAFAALVYIVMEVIKWIGWLIGATWEAGHEGRTLGESWYQTSVIMGESGGIMARITDMMVTMGGAAAWLSDWFSYLGKTAYNAMARATSAIGTSWQLTSANQQWVAGAYGPAGSPEAKKKYEQVKADIEAGAKAAEDDLYQNVTKPNSEFWNPFFKSLTTGVVGIGTVALASAITGGIAAPVIMGLVAAYATAGTEGGISDAYYAGEDAKTRARLGDNPFISARDSAKNKIFTNMAQQYMASVGQSGYAGLFGKAGESIKPIEGTYDETKFGPSFLTQFGKMIDIGSESGLTRAEDTKESEEKAQKARMTENEAKYKVELKNATVEEKKVITDQYNAYLVQEKKMAEKIAAGYKASVYEPSANLSRLKDPFEKEVIKSTVSYGARGGANPYNLAPPKTTQQYQNDGNLAAVPAERVTYYNNTITQYLAQQAAVNARTMAVVGAGSPTTLYTRESR